MAWVLLAVVLLAVGVSAVLVLPRRGAIQFLLAVKRPPPKDGVLPEGMLHAPEGAYGPRRVRVLAKGGTGAGVKPGMVVVHGVTEKGVDDGRLLGLVFAFAQAGFTVVLPELDGLVKMPADGRDTDRLLELLRAIEAGRVPGVDPARFGLFGVSVGGPVALGAAARLRKDGGRGLRALCLVGAPDDIRRSVRGWFVPPADGGWLERTKAAEFARSTVHRAGLDAEVPEEDRPAVRAWLETAWTPAGEPEGLRTEAARAFVARARATAPSDADVERATEAAWRSLKPLSPAHAEVDLPALRGLPVFLIHGEKDPLVPVSELPLLAARLGAFTEVRSLRSALLGHVEVGSQEAWDHVLFLDQFFDAVTE